MPRLYSKQWWLMMVDCQLASCHLLEDVQGTQASTTFDRHDTTVILKVFHESFLPFNFSSIDPHECREPVFPFILGILRYSQTRPNCIIGTHIF